MTASERDQAKAMDGDRMFLGVESRLAAGSLEPGQVCMARNTRMRGGKLETRRGVMKMNWVGRLAAPFPLVFPIDFTHRTPFVEVFGAGRWEDPAEVDWIVMAGSVTLAAGAKVWAAREGNRMVEVPLPTGEAITADVSFVQAFGKLFLFRGDDAAPLVMTDLDVGFEALSLTDANVAAGLSLIPNAASAIWVQNRLIVPHGRDSLDVSDALDPEHVYTEANRFRVNVGSSDKLTGVFKFNDTTLVIAKQSSIYVLNGLTPDAEGRFSSAQLDTVTSSWGFVARRSVAHCGADLIGLTQMGVMGVRQTEQNKLQGIQAPLSAPMDAVMKRVNWRHAPGAAAAYWDSKYYLALPLDDAESLSVEMMWSGAAYTGGHLTIYGLEPGRSYRLKFGANDGDADCGEAGEFAAENYETVDFVATQGSIEFTVGDAGAAAACTASLKEVFKGVNNAVIVYDFIRNQWDGYDDGEAMRVKEFVTLEYRGQERLFFVSSDGFLNLMEEGFQDEVWRWGAYPDSPADDFDRDNGVVSTGIETEWTLRGYGLRSLRNDGYQKSTIGESRFRAIGLALRMWNPTYSIFARPEGVNEETTLIDARQRSRTVYDRPWDAAQWVVTNENDDHGTPYRGDYSVVLDSGIYLGSGLNFDAHQELFEQVRVNARAQACQLRILNTTGRIELLRTQVQTQPGRQRQGGMV